MLLNRDKTVETFREAVLDALDKAAAECFGQGTHGATDGDLPRLFKAVDYQVDILATRRHAALVDYDPEETAMANPLPAE